MLHYNNSINFELINPEILCDKLTKKSFNLINTINKHTVRDIRKKVTRQLKTHNFKNLDNSMLVMVPLNWNSKKSKVTVLFLNPKPTLSLLTFGFFEYLNVKDFT